MAVLKTIDPSVIQSGFGSRKKKKLNLKPLLIALILIIAVVAAVYFVSGLKPVENPLFTDSMAVYGVYEDEVDEWGNQVRMYGVIDKKGKVILKAKYAAVMPAGKDRIFAATKKNVTYQVDGQEIKQPDTFYALFDTEGERLTGFDFSAIQPGNFDKDKLIAVQVEDKWGFINKNGKLVIKPMYYSTLGFSEGLCPVQQKAGGKWCYIDTKGKIKIEAKYENAFKFEDGLAIACADGKYGFINEEGKWKVKNNFVEVGAFSDDLAPALNEDGKWGYINKNGKWKIKAQYMEAREFSEGMAAVQHENGKWGYVDKTGKQKTGFRYNSASVFKDGLACVQKDGDLKYGYINPKGDMVIKPISYTQADFNCGLACITTDSKGGETYDHVYINKKGKSTIDKKFLYAGSFYDDGYAVVSEKANEFTVINKKGKSIFQKFYNEITTNIIN